MTISIQSFHVDSITQMHELMPIHTVIKRIRIHLQRTRTMVRHLDIDRHIIIDSLTQQHITVELTELHMIPHITLRIITLWRSLLMRQSDVCTLGATEQTT